MITSRDEEGNNIFGSRTYNILTNRKNKQTKSLSDLVPSSKLGWKGRIAKHIAPQYLDRIIRDEMGPGIATVADGVIRWNNGIKTVAMNSNNYFKENNENYTRHLGSIIKNQSEYGYGGKRIRKTRRKTRRKTSRKTSRKPRRKKTRVQR